MELKSKFRPNSNNSIKFITFNFLFGVIIISLLTFPLSAYSLDKSDGENLFVEHCAGCHIKGGNIVRRNKTLKKKDLDRNGIDTPDAIAKIAREGIGSMSGYKDLLGEKGDEIVANWIWDQAHNAWIQG